jgi:hypothetical protein
MTQVAEAREMARNAQWPPMLDGTVDPAEAAAYLAGLTGESLTAIANRYRAGLTRPRVPAQQIPGLLDLIDAGRLAETTTAR